MIESNKEFSKDYFDAGTSGLGKYSSYEAERFYPAFTRMVAELQKTLPGKKVLDVGCAKGFLVDELRKKGYEAYGTDISEYAIKNCPPGISSFLQVCDLNTDRFAFPDASFDIIICMGTLEYVKNQDHALSEINRVLKKGGILLMTTLGRVAAEDELRKYAKNEEAWQSTFAELGYSSRKEVAVKIFSAYMKEINEFDFVRSLNGPNGKSLKMKMVGFVFKTFGKNLINNYLFSKTLKSGYLMLGYTKQ